MPRGKKLKPDTVVQLAECPECGSLKTPVQNTGHDEDGHHIRVRKCDNCGERFGTIEIVLPPDFSFHRTNVKSELNRKYAARYSKDRIFVGSIRIIKGKLTPYCKRGLHKMEGKNLKIRTDGDRQCRACLNIARRRNKLAKGDQIRKSGREWYQKNKPLMNERQRARYHARKQRERYALKKGTA